MVNKKYRFIFQNIIKYFKPKIFIKKTDEIYKKQKANKLSDIEIQPGDIVISFTEDGEIYGVCGCVLATEIETSRQIEYKPKK